MKSSFLCFWDSPSYPQLYAFSLLWAPLPPPPKTQPNRSKRKFKTSWRKSNPKDRIFKLMKAICYSTLRLGEIEIEGKMNKITWSETSESTSDSRNRAKLSSSSSDIVMPVAGDWNTRRPIGEWVESPILFYQIYLRTCSYCCWSCTRVGVTE